MSAHDETLIRRTLRWRLAVGALGVALLLVGFVVLGLARLDPPPDDGPGRAADDLEGHDHEVLTSPEGNPTVPPAFFGGRSGDRIQQRIDRLLAVGGSATSTATPYSGRASGTRPADDSITEAVFAPARGFRGATPVASPVASGAGAGSPSPGTS